MNYKIKITEENQAIVKRIANENEMNPWGFDFNPEFVSYEIMEGKFVYIGTILNSEFRILTTEKFIEMFDKKQTEWKPKRGERVLVWDNDESDTAERIFLAEIEGAAIPIIVVRYGNESEFLNNKLFYTIGYKYMKQIQKPEVIVETDFKTKVVELFEKRIAICKESVEKYKNENRFYAAEVWKNCKNENAEMLKQIKEL